MVGEALKNMKVNTESDEYNHTAQYSQVSNIQFHHKLATSLKTHLKKRLKVDSKNNERGRRKKREKTSNSERSTQSHVKMVTNIQKVHTCVNFVKTFPKNVKNVCMKTLFKNKTKTPSSSASQSQSLRPSSPRKTVLFRRPEAVWSWVEGDVGSFLKSLLSLFSFACIRFRFRFCHHYKVLVPPPAQRGWGQLSPWGARRVRPHIPTQGGATRGCLIYIRAAVAGSKTADTSGCTEGMICELEHKTPHHGSVQTTTTTKERRKREHTSSHTSRHVIGGLGESASRV